MKQCPTCHAVFPSEDVFCPHDGATLAIQSAGDSARVVMSSDHQSRTEAPRQVVQTPSLRTSNGTPAWLYVLTGALATVVLMGGAYFLLLRSHEKDTEKASVEDSKVSTNSNLAHGAPQSEPPALASPAATATPVVSGPSPNRLPTTANGRWSGDWTTPSGAYLNVIFSLGDDGTGRVSGQIDWTLRRTTRPDRMSKIGMSAIEYVNGNFDPVTRKLSLQGYRKDDPNGVLVMLDQYRLTLSADERRLSGSAKNGGKWNGRVNLTR